MSLLGAYPWSPLFQSLLDGLGWVLAKIYDVIPNYGVSIIVLTVLIRLVLFPLGVKQIKSMQAMQAIQPKVKEIQKKYKGNKTKAQEETMKLYRDMGVNPIGGCLPLLLQFPILIAMYAVIRPPTIVASPSEGPVTAYEIHNNHLPVDSALFGNVVSHHGTDFIYLNLQCSAAQAGTQVQLNDTSKDPIRADVPLEVDGTPIDGLTARSSFDCGSGPIAKVPYFVILAFMIGTTFYQQRQMTKASPTGAQSSQQQTIMKVMPIMFGVFGYTFPAGLVVYWTTSNLWQVGQQTLLLRAGHIGPDALERRQQEIANRPPKTGGMFSGMAARAEEERKRREAERRTSTPKKGGPKGGPKKPPPKGSRTKRPPAAGPGSKPKPKKKPGGSSGS